MELWTYEDDGEWQKCPLGKFPDCNGMILFDFLIACGVTSLKDVPESCPYRLIVFSPEECRLLGILGEQVYSQEPAFSFLRSVVIHVIENIGSFKEGEISALFEWAHVVYPKDDDFQIDRKCTPDVLYKKDDVFSLSPPDEREGSGLAIDLDGRFTQVYIRAALAQEGERVYQ